MRGKRGGIEGKTGQGEGKCAFGIDAAEPSTEPAARNRRWIAGACQRISNRLFHHLFVSRSGLALERGPDRPYDGEDRGETRLSSRLFRQVFHSRNEPVPIHQKGAP